MNEGSASVLDAELGDTDMTRREAIAAMDAGKAVAHRWFSSDEWLRKSGGGYYEFEDGVLCPAHEFWKYRGGENWQSGWRVVEPNAD